MVLEQNSNHNHNHNLTGLSKDIHQTELGSMRWGLEDSFIFCVRIGSIGLWG